MVAFNLGSTLANPVKNWCPPGNIQGTIESLFSWLHNGALDSDIAQCHVCDFCVQRFAKAGQGQHHLANVCFLFAVPIICLSLLRIFNYFSKTDFLWLLEYIIHLFVGPLVIFLNCKAT